MLWMALALSAAASISGNQTPASATLPSAAPAVDVSALKIGAPRQVAELDLGKLKGELRQLAWSPDGQTFYIQTAEGNPQAPKLRHYTFALGGSAAPASVEAQPEWASRYWAEKSDRMAPGIGSLMIDVEQKIETLKFGTGSAGAAEGGDRAGGGTVMSANNLDREAQRQQQMVTRLKLLDETVSEFVETRPIPGLMFGWGPEKSGTIAYTDRDGRLMLLDRNKHKQTVSSARDALLPAWSTDGTRLAWVQKSGRRKYSLVCADVTR